MSRRERDRGLGTQRIAITLACEVCQARNYKTTKRQEQTVAMKKFCSACATHTLHRESK